MNNDNTSISKNTMNTSDYLTAIDQHLKQLALIETHTRLLTDFQSLKSNYEYFSKNGQIGSIALKDLSQRFEKLTSDIEINNLVLSNALEGLYISMGEIHHEYKQTLESERKEGYCSC